MLWLDSERNHTIHLDITLSIVIINLFPRIFIQKARLQYRNVTILIIDVTLGWVYETLLLYCSDQEIC